MATLGTNVLTLADWAKRLDPNGKVEKTVEILSQTNQILDDMLWKEGNLPTGHRTGIRTGLPSVYWRLINQGVTPSKSTTTQVDEQCGMLEAWSEVDKDLAEMNGNVGAFRLDEARAFLEAMNQEQADTVFYGSAANPEEFIGLSNRYSDLSATNAQNILDAGGSGSDNSSIWLVGWGANECFGIFPKGSKAGIMHEDLGLVTVETTAGIAGNRMRAYQDHWQWKSGLVVKDWRYAVRIANVDISDLAGVTGTQAVTASTSIMKLMARAIDRLPTLAGVTPTFYANRSVRSLLRVAAMDKSSSAVTVETAMNQFGKPQKQMFFDEVPVKLVDRLTTTETQIT
jgi:hypothetical protein